jgi:hypothetical protein
MSARTDLEHDSPRAKASNVAPTIRAPRDVLDVKMTHGGSTRARFEHRKPAHAVDDGCVIDVLSTDALCSQRVQEYRIFSMFDQ